MIGAGKEGDPPRQIERLVRERAHGGDPARPQEVREPEHRPERVGVRVQVAGDRHLVGPRQDLRRPAEGDLPLAPVRHRIAPRDADAR